MKKHFWKFLFLPLFFLAVSCSGVDKEGLPFEEVEINQVTPSNPSNNGNEEGPPIAQENPSQTDKYIEFSLINFKSVINLPLDPNNDEFKLVLEGSLIFDGGNQPEPCCGGRIVRVADFTNQRFVDVRAEKGVDEGHLLIEILTTPYADLEMYIAYYDFDTDQEGVLQDCSSNGCVPSHWMKIDSPLD